MGEGLPVSYKGPRRVTFECNCTNGMPTGGLLGSECQPQALSLTVQKVDPGERLRLS